MKKNINTLSLFCFVAGILLLLWPQAKDIYYDWRQTKLLEQTEQSFSVSGEHEVDPRAAAEYEQLSQLFMQVNESPAAEEEEVPEASPAPQAEPEPKQDKQAVALLSIDKINLKLPVLEGATEENMKYAAAHMTETAALGEVGNAAIAAHRVRNKGKLFNRLNEMEVGDKIELKIKDKKIVYTVYNVVVVKPTDTWVLKSNKKDQVLTLITCDPIVNATHRLIVQAKPNPDY
ncbi:class D sortase [Paenibacillus contaminans]|uniref:Class C sortase n=1 Tax=Paenibacillus contaminans TaxID=450362 RepID=A0A329MBC8_9BACL|nr:class D sortase [Paenibacillus contaminans]RAV17331.1 class C sortase [Paenibacillus contaminans]